MESLIGALFGSPGWSQLSILAVLLGLAAFGFASGDDDADGGGDGGD